ncbi:MAG: hypothetical protein JWP37_4 [Mucilaginibacter sp.]|nr:hypothetical protein [Mucilaginibacter sp.]
MVTMKKITLLLLASLFALCAMAQDFPYGKPDNEAMEMKSYTKDTSAHAVVLQEHGSSRITTNNLGEIRLIFDYHAKIKFFDSKEFEKYGTVEIPIYNADNEVYDNVTEITGVTFYKDDDGLVQNRSLILKKFSG